MRVAGAIEQHLQWRHESAWFRVVERADRRGGVAAHRRVEPDAPHVGVGLEHHEPLAEFGLGETGSHDGGLRAAARRVGRLGGLHQLVRQRLRRAGCGDFTSGGPERRVRFDDAGFDRAGPHSGVSRHAISGPGRCRGAEVTLALARQLLLEHEHVHVDVAWVERRDRPLPDRRVEHRRHQAPRHFRALTRGGDASRGARQRRVMLPRERDRVREVKRRRTDALRGTLVAPTRAAQAPTRRSANTR